MSVAIVPTASPLHDREAISRLLERVKRGVDGRDIDVLDLVTSIDGIHSVAEKVSIAIPFVLTGGTEHLLIELVNLTRVPLILYHRSFNSLPAAIEALSYLYSRGKRLELVDIDTFLNGIDGYVKLLKGIAKFVHGLRLGLIGGVSPWLVYSGYTPSALERIRVRVVEIGIDEVVELYRSIRESDVEPFVEKVLKEAQSVEVSRESVVDALRLYRALREVVDRYRLDILSIKCFDLIEMVGTTACLALALLNSEGIVAGCEGDIPATLAMAIGFYTTGIPGFMANVNEVYRDRVVVSHCTIPLAITSSYTLKTHFESGRGVGISGMLEEGKSCTLLRLSPELDRARIIRGRIAIAKPLRADLCRTQLVIEGRELDIVARKPMGNHYVVFPGDIVRELEIALSSLGIETETIG